MRIPCKDIAQTLKETLKQEVFALKQNGKTPKLVTVLLGQAPAQLSFVKIKRRMAEELGIAFEFSHFDVVPPFEEFLTFLQKKTGESTTTGIIIQHPLPPEYDHDRIYEVVPMGKEIEGHKPGSPYQFPLSLAVLAGLKYIVVGNAYMRSLQQTIVDFPIDIPFFKKHLKDKKIVIAGRGPTGGEPIGRTLATIGLSYQTVHSKTQDPQSVFRQADVIITATGKKIIGADDIKKGVILLNVGLRKENGKLRGDFDEEAIQEKTAYYNETPGGLGPLDVLYLYKNLLDTYSVFQ